eukprot:s240_g21.t1
MLLLKPVYGQLDALRRWYQEATSRRVKELGLRPHYLDSCCFLAFEPDVNDGESTTGVLGPNRLCGMVCLHVDDLLGSGNAASPTWQRILKELKDVFKFREWKDGDTLQYCGCSIEKLPGGLKLYTSSQVNQAKVSTAQELNRTLKFAKQNGDVGLTQAAAQAADATDIHLCRPDLQLVLRPVLITDAKALYGSYHRETVTANVTDRRTVLEIRVIKELLQDLSEELRWVNMEEHAAPPPPQRLRVINEDEMGENELGEDEAGMEESSEHPTDAEPAAATSGVYMVHTDEVIEYFDAVLPNFEDTNVSDKALQEKMRYGMSFTHGILPTFEPGWIFMIFFTVLCIVAAVAYVKRKLKQALETGYHAAWNLVQGELAQLQAFAILFARMNYEQEHIAREYRNFARNRDFLEDADRQRDAGVHVMRRALIESFQHADLRPFSGMIWVTEDDVRHAQPHCQDLPTGRLTEANGVRRFRPCPTCSSGEITPNVPDGQGVQLLTQLETWITDQGAEAWPVHMHG